MSSLQTVFCVLLLIFNVFAINSRGCRRILFDMEKRRCCAEEIRDQMIKAGCGEKLAIHHTNARVSKGKMKRCIEKTDYCPESSVSVKDQ